MNLRWRILATLGFIVCAVLGFAFRDRQYRLDGHYMPSDQAVLAHRDSAYTSMTWVASEANNYLQLRFFDKVEGGVLLRPSWQELIDLKDERLAHLVPETRPVMDPPESSWPHAWTPDPGTVSESQYVRLFPLGLLLNESLATDGRDHRTAPSRAFVVGLGSGVGIAVLAHHFPQLAVTVVDIDEKVIDLVRGHYPLLRWLSEQKTAAGEPRLRFVVGDARQIIREEARLSAKPYDLLILDAYTAGSTIPPHLMTREFFAQCASILTPDGILLGNIIGSYGRPDDRGPTDPKNRRLVGEKHRVLGGAIRSIRAAGLTSLVNFPVLGPRESTFDWGTSRNNIVVASRKPLAPQGASDARWERLKAFTLYPELPTGRWRIAQYQLSNSRDERSQAALVPASVVEADQQALRGKLSPNPTRLPGLSFPFTKDASAIDAAKASVARWAQQTRGGSIPLGWDKHADAMYLQDIDCVQYARDVFQVSVAAARDQKLHGGQALTGDPEHGDAHRAPDTATIFDAPLFTDERSNADILNR